MAIFRPKRGKKQTAIDKNIILKNGEVFFEISTDGTGKGTGRIKMGDGTTVYKDLPYFLEPSSVMVGATASANGSSGLVPTPSAGDNNKFLKGDGTWGQAMSSNNPTGTGSFSLNRKAGITIGEYSFCEGYNNEASGAGSHAEGSDTTASARFSHAEGSNTTASNNCSHAEGCLTKASGIVSHAECNCTTASGQYSHAEGSETIASGNYGSHAEGWQTTASGIASHAEGFDTEAIGTNSHAEGCQTKASGDSSHASGQYTVANKDCQFVVGYSNNPQEDSIFEVGNGITSGGGPAYGDLDSADMSARILQNAFRVTQSGTAIAQTGLGIGDDFMIGKPGTEDQSKFLRGDGTWQKISSDSEFQSLQNTVNGLSILNIVDYSNDIVWDSTILQSKFTTNVKMLGSLVLFTMNMTVLAQNSYAVNIGTLPEACRPQQSFSVNTLTNKGYKAYIFVDPDGKFGYRMIDSVTIQNGDGIRYFFPYSIL